MTTEKGIKQRMQQLQITPEKTDDNTLFLGLVPVHPDYFNKERSNVLVKRAGPGKPFLLFVDEDLEYLGKNSDMARAFAGALFKRGWRGFDLALKPEVSMETAVEAVFEFLGVEGTVPGVTGFTRVSDLDGIDDTLLSQDIVAGKILKKEGETLEREAYVTRGAACFLREDEKHLLLIIGPSGVGKTNLIHGVAKRLASCRPAWTVSVMDLAQKFSGTVSGAECEGVLDAILNELRGNPDKILFLEHFDLVLQELPRGGLLVAGALDDGCRIGGTVTRDVDTPALPEALARRTCLVELEELDFDATVHILQEKLDTIARQYDIEIDGNMAGAAVTASLSLPGFLPAKALSLLHAAAARALLAGVSVVGLDDIYAAAAYDAYDGGDYFKRE